MSTDTLTLRQINRATLARQMLLAREKVAPVKVIERLVGMQAQWPRPPFVGLWSRVEGFAREDLVALLDKRQVVRATFLRGTIHLVTARDFAAMRPVIQPVLEASMQSILRERLAGIDIEDVVARARAFFGEKPRTFEDLRDHFLADDPDADERAMGYAVRMRLPLVQVPVGAQATWAFPAKASFALAAEWLGRAMPHDAPAKADQFVLRYLAAYGPAYAKDLQAWSGAQLRDTLEALRPRLRVFHDEKKRELFDLPDAPRPDGDVPAPVRLIAEYDNVIGTRADERFVAKVHRPKVFLSALRVAGTVLVDGFVAATWKIEVKKKAATITIEPFAPFSARTRKEVTAEAETLVRFAEPDAGDFQVQIAK